MTSCRTAESSLRFDRCTAKSGCATKPGLRKELGDFLFELGLLERAALNLIQAGGVHEKLGAQEPQQLTHVELRHENFLIALQDFAEIRRKRVQVAQVHVADLAPAGELFALRLDRGGNRAVGGAPGHDEQIALGISGRLNGRNILRNGFHFRGADANHFFVIQRLIIDVAGDVLLFEAADAMLEAGCAGNGPGTRERLRITAIRSEVQRVRGELHGNIGNLVDVGNAPGLRAVGQVAVREKDYRNHVLYGDAAGFESGPEAIAWRGGGDDRNRSFGVASEESLEQVGLLGLGRQTGGWAAALDVANDERQFDGDGETKSFRLERHSRTGSGGYGEGACVGCADRGSDGGDFVFGLEGHYAEIFVLGQFVKNVRSRRDRIAALKEAEAGFLRSGDEAESQRLIAAQIAIHARLELCRRNLVADLERFGGFAVGIARF